MQHSRVVEPLSVAAYIAAINAASRTANRGWVVDVGANMGFYTVLGATIAPNFQMLSVEMQPKCAQIITCGLLLNRLPNCTVDRLGLLARMNSLEERVCPKVTVLNRYVGDSSRGPIDVPAATCDTMASPSAVGGRRPDGRLRSTEAHLNQTLKQAVRPIMLGKYLVRHMMPGERVAVVKIDTEGFEARALESLRPAWPVIDDIVLEIQPAAWRYHGLSLEEGIGIFRDLFRLNKYRAVSLPKRVGQKGRFVTADLVDPCSLPVAAEDDISSFARKLRLGGLGNAVVGGWSHLEAVLREAADTKHWPELLLTRKQCPTRQHLGTPE